MLVRPRGEREYETVTDWLFGNTIMQADISTAIAWNFARNSQPEIIGEQDYPALAALSKKAEALDAFKTYPYA